MRLSALLPPADNSSRYVLVIIKLPDPYDIQVQRNTFIICFRLFVPIKTARRLIKREMNIIVRTSRPTAALRVTASTSTYCPAHTYIYIYTLCVDTALQHFFFKLLYLVNTRKLSNAFKIAIFGHWEHIPRRLSSLRNPKITFLIPSIWVVMSLWQLLFIEE